MHYKSTTASKSAPASERAVEVVTTLGDSVIDVAHLATSDERPSRRSALLMLGAAALFMALAAGAFAKGVTTAANNERAELAWIQDPGRVADDFRPQLLSPVYDWAAVGGLVAGLLAFGLGLSRLRASRERTSITIGTARDADINTAAAPAPLCPLVSQRQGQAIITVSPGMSAEMRAHGHRRDLEQLAALGLARPSAVQPGCWELSVPDVGIVNVHVGSVRVGIRSVAMERSRLSALFASFDQRMGQFFGMSAIAHMAVLALFYTLPPDAYSLTMDPDGGQARMRKIKAKASEAVRTPPPVANGSANTPDNPNSIGGNKQHVAENPEYRPMSPGGKSAGHRRPSSRTEARELARRIGIVGILAEQADQLSIFDGGPVIAMSDEAVTSLILDDEGPGGTRFGGPNVGFKTEPGTIKAGDYDTIGNPDGDPNARLNRNNPGPTLRSRPDGQRAPKVVIDKPIIHGELDKSIIRRYIKRKLARIQYCYEKELTVNPDISGTVTTEFMVSPQGTVVYATASGIGNKRLESCIAGAVKSVQFPKPSDRSSVKVKYPFHFRHAG